MRLLINLCWTFRFSLYFLLVPGAFAATPVFTYQGRLTDGGVPANGSYDLRFVLFDAAAAGTQVGSAVFVEDLAVTDGLFQVELSFGAGTFAGEDRWLETAVRPGDSLDDYALLAPRQPINPVPYPLYALSGNPGPEGPPG